MNAKIEYYKQLQQISVGLIRWMLYIMLRSMQATLAPWKPRDDADQINALDRNKNQMENSSRNLIILKAKKRYLVHLRQESTDANLPRTCLICQHSFEIGALTVCGHVYCKECMHLWWKEHRNCPMCKRSLKRNEFQQITYVVKRYFAFLKPADSWISCRYKPREVLLEEEPTTIDNIDQDQSSRSEIYSTIQSEILNQIKEIDLNGSYSCKVDNSTLMNPSQFSI